jgi:hypothetical protein
MPKLNGFQISNSQHIINALLFKKKTQLRIFLFFQGFGANYDKNDSSSFGGKLNTSRISL